MTGTVTLSELTQVIRSAIYGNIPDTLWVVAEISELHQNKSGHCYLELAEKDISEKRIIARMKGIIWANVFRNLKPYFEKTTGYSLTAGIKVMMLVHVDFHEVYGMSLNIHDIDPAFTMGDIARKKHEVINRLRSEGIIEMNKTIRMPSVIQRIAVISSETAAGYGDFLDTVQKNQHGIRFYTKLFPAIMQGEKAELSVIKAFDEVFDQTDIFDVVVLIRGGGSQLELDCFNSYELSFHITQFPIPVLTGIGHERDETVADIVANGSFKTPTAVADFIVNHTGCFLELLDNCAEQLVNITQKFLSGFRDAIHLKSLKLNMNAKEMLGANYNILENFQHLILKNAVFFKEKKSQEIERTEKIIKTNVFNRIQNEQRALGTINTDTLKVTRVFLKMLNQQLNNMDQNLEYLDPLKILRRGYSLTSYKGKIIKTTAGINPGDIIDTLLYQGRLSSRVFTKNRKQ